ncbi:MAG TPA: MFS transporter [Oceanospirillaceae bacterium]|nr:MFS transporter [Oceanospirillaceae bacterium]
MPFSSFTRNVWLLCLAQVFAFTGANVTIFLGGIVGSLLAPSLALATLPVAAMIVGTASGTIPAAMLMSKMGRRFGFVGAAVLAATSALLGALAIWNELFWIYCLACLSLGVSMAFVQQYRFAAAESVPSEVAPNAISAILLAGIAGAFLGPNVANYAKDWFPEHAFVGSYIALSLMVIMPALILSKLRVPEKSLDINEPKGRSVKELAIQPDFILAVMAAATSYALMSFLMTATPVSMHVMDGHSIHDTGVVIQWHIVGMFLPSLFVGKLIRYYGHRTIMTFGIAAMIVCIIVGQISQTFAGYWLSLVMLGVGWNFLFVSGTALLITSYKEAEKYRAQAFNDFLVFGFQAIAALSAGWVLSATSWKTINLMSLPFLALLLMVIGWSHMKNKAL